MRRSRSGRSRGGRSRASFRSRSRAFRSRRGLGDVAIRYGYQRFDTTVMVAVIVILVALVSLVQGAGDTAVRHLRAR